MATIPGTCVFLLESGVRCLARGGADDKHASWKEANGTFASVEAFLESDNSAGAVRDQLAIYTHFLMFDTRIRYEASATERERDTWTAYREAVPMVDELDVSDHVASLTAKVQSVHAAQSCFLSRFRVDL